MSGFKILTDGTLDRANLTILNGEGGRVTSHLNGISKIYSTIMLFSNLHDPFLSYDTNYEIFS